MTVLLYDNGTLYTDSKKISSFQNNKVPIALTGTKIRLIAGGSIAYASCGSDPLPNDLPILENNIRAIMFTSWLGRQLIKTPIDPKLKTATNIWLEHYNKCWPDPLDEHHVIAISRDIVLDIHYQGSRNKPEGSCTYLDITDQDGHMLSVSPLPFAIYKRLGMSTMKALKRVIETSDICDYPIQFQHIDDLEPLNYPQFIDFLIAKHPESAKVTHD